MDANDQTRGRQPVEGTLHGAFRSVLLGWTDPESGDRLTMRMRGERGLLDSLEPLGFEVLEGGDPLPERGAPAGARVWSFRAQRARRARAVSSALAPCAGSTDGTAAAG